MAAKYKAKFPQLSDNELKEIVEQFNGLAVDGRIGAKQIVDVYSLLKETITIEDARQLIGEYDEDHDGTLVIEEFLAIFAKGKEGVGQKAGGGKRKSLLEGLNESRKLIQQKGAGGAERSYAQEEVSGYVQYLNSLLEGDEDLKPILPINPEDDTFFKNLGDGLLLCKLVNMAQPDTVDERVIAKGKKLNAFSKSENITLGLNSAKAIGISTVNIGNTDIRDGTIHLVLGLTWQLIRMSLVKDIQLNNVPELIRLLEPGETYADLLKLSPEQILLRWLNYHLKNGGSDRRVKNFTTDIHDSEVYTIVLNQIAPQSCSKAPLSESDLNKRAEATLKEADKIGCRKFLTPNQIVKGNQRLNLAFVANLFNTKNGLPPLTEAELAALDEALFAAGGDRIERQYALWINSSGAEPFVINLFDGLQDGLILLQMFDKISPGSVNWKTVHKDKLNKFKCVENLNQAVEIGKKLGFSLVNIGGSDIYDKNKKLTLALLWQMMRYDYLKIFTKLGGGSRIKDEQIVEWANGVTAAKGVKIASFKDDQISNSKPILTLIDILKPDTIDWGIFEDSEEEAKRIRNAKYVLSVVRKYGGAVYALPEDIVEHNPQMVLTVYASLMAMAGAAA